MKLLETYAVNCGAKIDKPFIYQTFFPLPLEKYITFQAQSKYEAKDYAYFQDVINILYPILIKNNIHIIQVGLPNEATYQRVVDLRGKTSYNQLAYVINKSMLHFGPDSLGVHIASSFDIPIVALYSVIQPEVAGPHFGSPEKQILFKGYTRIGNGKPSYSQKEEPKSINTIKPEEIANSIFKLLNVDFVTPFNTIYTGPRYSKNIIRELLPNSLSHLENPEAPVELRYDLVPNIDILGKQLNYFNKSVIRTKEPIDINFLRMFKNKIAVLVYSITENDDPEFVKQTMELGIPTLLISSLDQQIINNKKINYYESGLINSIPMPPKELLEKLRLDIDNLYYKSCKLIGSDGIVYSSHAARKEKIPYTNNTEYQKIIDNDEFWQDLDFFTIVKKLDNNSI